MTNCPIHPSTPLVSFCPKCRGEAKSEKKSASSRKNGKKGGAPRKKSGQEIVKQAFDDLTQARMRKILREIGIES